MNTQQHLSGKLDVLRVHRPNRLQKAVNRLLPSRFQLLGRVIHEERDIANLILNAGMNNSGPPISFFGTRTCNFRTFESVVANSRTFNDLTFTRQNTKIYFNTSDPEKLKWLALGNELITPTGERSHITSEILGGNNFNVSRSVGVVAAAMGFKFYNTSYAPGADPIKQFKTSALPSNPSLDYTGGFGVKTWAVVMDASATAYSLGSVCIEFNNGSHGARVVLPSPVAIASGDQISMRYTLQVNAVGRETHPIVLSQAVTGYPVGYTSNSVISTGPTTVQVQTTTNNHFALGDEITIENAGGYNGTFVINAVVAPSVFLITSSATGANPTGAIISSPDIATETVYGGIFEERYTGAGNWFGHAINEANKKTIPAVSKLEIVDSTGYAFQGVGNSLVTLPSHENDWTTTYAPDPAKDWNSGGVSENRVKQILLGNAELGQQRLIEFRTPQPKLNTHKMKLPSYRVQMVRNLL